MIDPRFLRIEELFDQRKKPQESDRESWPEGADLAESLVDEDWKKSRSICRRIFESTDDSSLRAFAIQWGVASSELEYDLQERKRWIDLWDRVEGWAKIPYARFLRTFHEGLSRFFSGSLKDAESRFADAHEIAIAMGYIRGKQRALQHLGLVYRDLGNAPLALSYFHQALALARTRKATVQIDRIMVQIERLDPGSTARSSKSVTRQLRIEHLQQRIESELLAGHVKKARGFLAQAEQLRREGGISRRRFTLATSLALVHWARGRSGNGDRVWSRIQDAILRIQVLELKKKIPGLGLQESESAELDSLRVLHGLSRIIVRGELNHAEICGIRLDSVRELDLQKLMTALMRTSGTLGKEALCMQIWGLKYDPVSHDGRIYKLIHRARKTFGKDDLIVNHYGSYRLNPRYYNGNGRSSFRVS